VRLREIPAETYAREVLPLTAGLWAGRRTFDEYVAQTLEIARSAYGRRHYRTIGLYDGSTRVASFKEYERTLHHGSHRLRAIGFGAVFTVPEHRDRGYASVMLASALDRARAQGYELAYLFSDLRPQFYAALGFHALASRQFSVSALALPAMRLRPVRLGEEAWNGVRRLFELGERRRNAGFVRNSATWEWIRMRVRHASEHLTGQEANLIVRRQRGIAAYVFGVRAPAIDAYVVDEYGFADAGAAEVVPALLRAAAGDLRRVTGWLPPDVAREALPRIAVRRRKGAILMMAPLRPAGERLLQAAAAARSGDFCWASDHV
jgi:GNAT superfamily N-acetyltransferase